MDCSALIEFIAINLAAVGPAYAMFSSLSQRAGFSPGLALQSTIPRLLMATSMVGGAGSLLSAGSAHAIDTCYFGTPNPASTAPLCLTTPGFLSTGDKTLTFRSLPSRGTGQIDFTNSFTDYFDVRVLFSPPLDGPTTGPQISGAFEYDIDIVPGNPYVFKGVGLQVNARQDVDIIKADVTTGGPYFNQLVSIDSSSPIPGGLSFAPISGNRTSLSVRDSYSLGLGRLTSFTNSFQQVRTDVPGPLPVLGAGMAFGFSRKLRRRIKVGASA